FSPPKPPSDPTADLRNELQRLQAELEQHRQEAQKQRIRAEELEARSRTAEERATKEAEERAIWQSLAEEAETRALSDQPSYYRTLPAPPLGLQERSTWEALEAEAAAASGEVQAELQTLQHHAAQLPGAVLASLEEGAKKAADEINLDE